MTVTNVATKLARFLVEFTYGDPVKVERYILNAQEPLTVQVDGTFKTFNAFPGTDIDPGAYSLALTDEAFTITLPVIANGFTDLASRGEPFSHIEVKVWEVLDSVLAPGNREILLWLDGRVAEVVRNFRGKSNSVGFRCISCKDELKVPMGLPINATCPWIFTSPTCGVVTSPNLATVNSIFNKAITVTWNTGPVLDPEYYFRGYVQLDGVRIMVRAWDVNDPNEIGLVTSPPLNWIGLQLEIFPGCDKTIETCRDRWNNEIRFGGSGFKMPSYKPNFETPS